VATAVGWPRALIGGAAEEDTDRVRASAVRFTIEWRGKVEQPPWPPDPKLPICIGQAKGSKVGLREIRDPARIVLESRPRHPIAIVAWSKCPGTGGRLVVGDVRWTDADRAETSVAWGAVDDLSRGLDLELERTADGWAVVGDFPGLWAVDAN
jgi:hypothetical protein